MPRCATCGVEKGYRLTSFRSFWQMSARRSISSDSEQDLKAVFLAVFKSLEARIKSKEDLLFGEEVFVFRD